MKTKHIKPKTVSKSQLAEAYNVSTKTMVSWLKRIDVETGRRKIFTPKEPSYIYMKLGAP